MVRKILFLAANPEGTAPINWGKEFDEITNKVRDSKGFDQVTPKFTTGFIDLQKEMQENKPQIVHFVGHGDLKKKSSEIQSDSKREISDKPEPYLIFQAKNKDVQGEPVSKEELAQLFGRYADQLECIILNACYTEGLVPEIAKKIQVVIGWEKSVYDDVAIKFSSAFYEALVTTGCSYQKAYATACEILSKELKPVPELYKHGVEYQKEKEKENEIFQQITDNLEDGFVTLFIGSGINSYGRKNIDWEPKTDYTPTEREIAKYLVKNCKKKFTQKVKATYLNKQEIEEQIREELKDVKECPEDCPLNPGSSNSTKKCPLLITDIMAAAAIQPNLEYLTECIEIIIGLPNLYKYLNNIFQPKENYVPNLLHCLLAELPKVMLDKSYLYPYELIVTTNYDDTLEEAFKKEKQPFDLVYYIPEKEKFCHLRYENKGGQKDAELELHTLGTINTANEYQGFYKKNSKEEFEYPVILKLYGTVNREQQIKSHLVITEDQHLEYEDIQGKIPPCIRLKLQNNHILFLGYDPSDWKLRTILRKIWPAQTRPAQSSFGSNSWVVQLHPGELETKIWDQGQTKIYDISLEEFTAKLNEWHKDLTFNNPEQ